MDKTKFIEKSREVIAKIIENSYDPDTETLNRKKILHTVESKLSECWDMAGEEKFTEEELMMAEHMQRAWWKQITKDTHKDWIKLSESLMRKINSLTSKQEDS